MSAKSRVTWINLILFSCFQNVLSLTNHKDIAVKDNGRTFPCQEVFRKRLPLAVDVSLQTDFKMERPFLGETHPDLKGEKLRIGIQYFSGVASFDENTKEYAGFSIDLLYFFAERLNFTYTLIQPDDGEWGSLTNGTWSGLVGLLDRKELDLTVATLSKDQDRLQVLDMIGPVDYRHYNIWLLNPALRDEKWLIIFDLMTPLVSVLFVVAFFSVVLVFTLIVDPKSNGDVFANRFMLFIQALLKQASSYTPQSVSGRTILAFWWWFSILISVFYTGTMISVLANNNIVYPFKSADELLESSYKYGIIGSSVMETVLSESGMSVHHQILNRIKQFAEEDSEIMSSDINVHMSKMKEEKYAFIGAPNLDRDGSGTFLHVHAGLESREGCICLPRHSPLSRPVHQVLKEMHHYGFLQLLLKKHGKEITITHFDSTPSSDTRVGMAVLKSAFYIVIFGVAISISVLFIEVVVYRIVKYFPKLKS